MGSWKKKAEIMFGECLESLHLVGGEGLGSGGGTHLHVELDKAV